MSGRKIPVISGLIVLLVAGEVLSGTIAFDPFPIGAGAYTNNVDFLFQGPTNSPIVGFTGIWGANTTLAESSTATVDAPLVLESGGTFRFTGNNDSALRTASRDFTELACADGDTNYWSAIVSLNGQDSNDRAYVKWFDTANTFMAMELGIWNGRLFMRLRELSSATFDLGSYIPGKAYHLVARAIISGGTLDPNYEDTTVWINPTRSDIRYDQNMAANYRSVSFISPGVNHDRVEVATQNIGGRIAYFDEILYTTDMDDLNLSIQKIQSATFTPMPRPDDSGSYNHLITHDFELASITLERGRYTDLEGPTNAWVTGGSGAAYPINGDTVAVNESLSGLHVTAAANISTAEVAFATTVTNGFSGGFFVIEANGDDYNIVVRPLDANRNPISDWSLTISGSTPWSGNLTGEGEVALNVRFNTASVKINGLAFTLGDFTGGSGVLADVHGLQFVDSSPSFDPVMVGIYRGPTEALSSGSSASPMTGATFNRALTDNPITNDFAIAGISTASRDWTSLLGASTANIHVDTLPSLYTP